MIDCETKVIFTKDPAYIINAHSWPEDSQKKPVSGPNNPVNANPQGQNPPGQGQTQAPGPNPNQNAPPHVQVPGQAPVQGQGQGFAQNVQNAIVNNVTANIMGRNPQPPPPQPTPNVISANPVVPLETSENPEDPNAGKQKLNKKERKDFLIKEMRKRIDQYFEINVRQVGDMVPKVVTNFLINDILVGLKG